MQKIFLFLLGFFTAFSVHAQQNSVVTFTVDGNKNLQLSVGGRDYNTNSGSTTGNKTTLSLNSLEMGQHSFQVSRTDQNSNQTDRISAVFNLRQGYDMLIKLNGNSSLELIETKRTGMADTQTPMSNTAFANLLRIVRAKQPASARRTAITNALTKNNNYFTSSQVRQLLQLVNAENHRIQLAKSSYAAITDRSNFYTIYDLVNSPAGRNELQEYVNNYNNNTVNNPNPSMPDASFNTLYQGIMEQWPVSTQMNSLSSTFINTANHFSTSQASQLIKLVTAENNRLQLAKLSWHRITDPANFNNVYSLLNTQAGKNELEAYVTSYSTGNIHVAMPDTDYNSLYQTIQQQGNASTLMASLNNAFSNSNNYFSTTQAKQLIRLVSTESNRLHAAKLSYRSITDPANFSQVSDLLNSQSGRDELAAYVRQYNGSSSPNPAMTDASFVTLFQSIQGQYFPNERMNSLTVVFNNSDNYFTSSQAKQLIQLVSLESNRLHLAKLSYRGIADRENFTQLYNLLSSQDSKDELDAYVKAYKV